MDILFPPNQELVFLNMAVVGVFLGILYDIFKLKRKLLGSFYIILFIDDLIFWIISAITFIFAVFISNNGIFRWYELCFTILGFIFYRVTLSKLLMPVAEAVIILIKRLVRMMIRTVLIPLIILLKPVNKLYAMYKCAKIRNKYKKIIYRYIVGLNVSGSEVYE